MVKKTVFAMALAGACAWPVAAFAWGNAHHVRTPMSDREVGPQDRHMGFMHRSDRVYVDPAVSDEGRYEVQTPLTVSETAPMQRWNSYYGWADPAPDSVRLSHSTYGHRVVVGGTRGEGETYYLVPERTETDYAIVPAR